jgi:hypothetical protein
MRRLKKILIVLLALFLVYILWLSFLLLNFKKYKTPSPKSPLEVEGVYHIHTRFSDGWSPADKIAKLASRAGLDFIILTDHGNPNYPSLQFEGWKDGLLVLSGAELSVSRGHLVGLGFKLPPHPFSQNTEEAVHEIATLGGFSIIAHPYSKVQWSWGEFVGYSGLEIINADTMLKKNILRLLPYLPTLLVKPEYAMLKMLDTPDQSLRKWDQMNSDYPLHGYFSTDAHVFYRPLFSLLRLHLLLQNPLSADFKTAKRQVYECLQKGNFYNAIDAAAQATGFGFWAEKDERRGSMGDTIPSFPVTLKVKAPYPFAEEIYIIHNGQKVYHSAQKEISFEASDPGAYRIEVYLKDRSPLGQEIPWIVSNPIYLRKD